MRLLIDSHALLWWGEASPALGIDARNAISDPTNEVLVSVAALWELVIKSASGKLTLPTDVETILQHQGFALLPIAFEHLRRYGTLPRHHRDPFDRMMVAQALTEGIPIATADRIFSAYGVQVLW